MAKRPDDPITAVVGWVWVGQEAAARLQVQVGVPALLGTRLDEVANVVPALRTLIGEKAVLRRLPARVPFLR